jgi:hypothetical protein
LRYACMAHNQRKEDKMEISDLINILKKIQEKQGDLQIVGECEDCGGSDMAIYVLTDDTADKCWLQVSSDN